MYIFRGVFIERNMTGFRCPCLDHASHRFFLIRCCRGGRFADFPASYVIVYGGLKIRVTSTTFG